MFDIVGYAVKVFQPACQGLPQHKLTAVFSGVSGRELRTGQPSFQLLQPSLNVLDDSVNILKYELAQIEQTRHMCMLELSTS